MGILIPYKGWRPDMPPYMNPGDNEASGVIPDTGSYRPLPSLEAVASSFDARARGSIGVTDTNGVAYIFGGDSSKLYQSDAATFADRSKSGGYATGDDGIWEFTAYGTKVIATNFSDAVQSFDFASSSAFADLFTSTLKPKARHCAVIGNFLVLGNTFDAVDGNKFSRIWWSGFDDVTDMDPSAATQSDFNDIPEGGWVQKVVGGEYGLVFQERQIVRVSYVGPDLIFQFDVIDKQRGTPIPNSVVSLGRWTFFISEEGFFFNNGVSSQAIGEQKVDRTFWNQFEVANQSQVSAAIDPMNKVVAWLFPGSGSSGSPNKMFMYHWPEGRWSQADVDAEILFNSIRLGYTLDELDSVSATLEALPYSLDSRAWTGGQLQMGAFNTSHAACAFTGDNVAATIDTTDIQLFKNRRAMIKRVRPLVDASAATVAVAGRVRLSDSVSYDTARAMNTSGLVTARNNNRYHRFRMAIPAATSAFTYAQGVEVDGYPLGMR